MNFLNPFALIGMLAAGIPILLHLLNLRKLKTIEFSSLRFLIELQQTRVRKLKLQQILLLILRTLLVAFAVLSFARPTIPSNLPLLSSAARSSVVILVDNSASMEADDQNGERMAQARSSVAAIIGQLRDGDEVCVIPIAGIDRTRSVGFTRTFAAAKKEADALLISEDQADIADGFRLADQIFEEAAYAHREVYVVSDAQRSTMFRDLTDTNKLLSEDVAVFLVQVGKGLDGVEKNLSVDSLNVLTKLFHPDKPVEIEAFVRNGSRTDAVGVVVSMAISGSRVAQRVVDIGAGSTVPVVISAPTQKSGMFKISVELEDDAINRDNYRYAGVTIPPRPKVLVVGSESETQFVYSALSIPGAEKTMPEVKRVLTLRDAAPELMLWDVVYLCGGVEQGNASLLTQFLTSGRGIVLFANDAESFKTFANELGVEVQQPTNLPEGTTVTRVESNHPLFSGVFKKNAASDQVIEKPKIVRLLIGAGGVPLVYTGKGTLVSEFRQRGGKIIYVGISPTLSWGSVPLSGLFAATLVRCSMYLTYADDAALATQLNQPISLSVPARSATKSSFVVTDVYGTQSPLQAVSGANGSTLSIPAQRVPGVAFVTTSDSTAVVALAVNGATDESVLEYFEDEDWGNAVKTSVVAPDRVVVLKQGQPIANEIRAARVGSELWPLFTVLALLCAVAEIFVQRFMAREANDTGAVA